MTTTDASSTNMALQNPPDCNAKGLCPCNVFERCRKRRAYGSDIWSHGKNKKQAMGFIAFDGDQGITDEKKLKNLWTAFIGRNNNILDYNKTHEKKIRFNKFFANLRSAGGKNNVVLVLPKMSDPYITQQMNKLRQSLYNTAVFTDFQRSMVVRANLVRNKLTLKSDTYRTRKGELDFDPIDLIPYAKGHRSEMWSVDHIQVKAKGGCNRFCNAAVLMLGDNSRRGDNGPGCPCITAVGKNDEIPDRETFKPKTNEPLKESGYQLFVCVTYHRNKKKGEAPDELPGTCHGNKPCNLDDPRKCMEAVSNDVVVPVYK